MTYIRDITIQAMATGSSIDPNGLIKFGAELCIYTVTGSMSSSDIGGIDLLRLGERVRECMYVHVRHGTARMQDGRLSDVYIAWCDVRPR